MALRELAIGYSALILHNDRMPSSGRVKYRSPYDARRILGMETETVATETVAPETVTPSVPKQPRVGKRALLVKRDQVNLTLEDNSAHISRAH